MSNSGHLFFLLLLSFIFVTKALTLSSDVAALAAIKASISPSSIQPYSCLASWNFSSDPCKPLTPSHFTCGFTCNDDSTRITSLTLDPAGYSGLLSPLISNLTLLTHLNLFDNSFYGSLPSSISQLSSLETIVVASNSFSGSIPTSLFKLTSLQTLDLSHNKLSGNIVQLPTSLRSLDLSFNSLTGSLPQTLPTSLIELAVRQNLLYGNLKRSMFEKLNWLEVVELGGNKLNGKVEGWLFLLPSLQQLDLSNNSLSGVEIWNGSTEKSDKLVAVDLSYNRIKGMLPVGFAGFPSLVALSLRQNELRGGIPWEYYGKKKGVAFRRLFLDGNYLKGRVPDGWLGGDQMAGSFGDNCLQSCPVSVSLCSPGQKPDWICKEVYASAKGSGL